MSQNLAPFHVENDKKRQKISPKAGAFLLLQLTHSTGIYEAAQSLNMRPHRGFQDGDHVVAAICLNTLGYSCCDDLEHLRKDAVLGTLHQKLKGHFGVEGRTEEAFPSPSTFRKWVHDLGDSPKSLKRLQELPAQVIAYAQERNPQKEATLDSDASFVPTARGEAPWNYKGEQADESFNLYWEEQDMMFHSEYTPGNVSPKTDPLGLLQRGLEKLPPGVETVSLRMDSAWYNMNLLRYCCEGTSSWGVIHFGISVPMYLSYRKEVRKLPEEAWQKRLLATIYGTPATLTRHAKQMVLKIGGKIGKMLQEAHWKLFWFHYKLE